MYWPDKSSETQGQITGWDDVSWGSLILPSRLFARCPRVFDGAPRPPTQFGISSRSDIRSDLLNSSRLGMENTVPFQLVLGRFRSTKQFGMNHQKFPVAVNGTVFFRPLFQISEKEEEPNLRNFLPRSI